jgi:hypothetical protein
MLEKMKDDPIPVEEKKPRSLNDAILLVLVQNECYRFCRSEIFCPFPECNKELRSQEALMQHIKNQHPLNGETVRCPDSIRYFIASMFSDILVTSLYTENGGKMEKEWEVERCHFSGCKFVHGDHQNVKGHGKRIHKNEKTIKKFGWF